MLSDEEILKQLDALDAAEGRNSPGINEPLNNDEELLRQLDALDALEDQEKNKPFLESAIETVGEVANTIDSVTGAPTRAAIGAIQDNKNPFTAFSDQFGEDTALAPTGKSIAQKMGISDASLGDLAPQIPHGLNPSDFVSDELEKQGFKIGEQPTKLIEKGDPLDISASGAAGLGVEIAADPLTVIPVGLGVKVAKKGLGAAARTAKEAGRTVLSKSAAARAFNEGIDTTTRAVKRFSKDTRQAVSRTLRPPVVEDFDRITETLKKNGINTGGDRVPGALEFGESSSVGTLEKVQREGVLGPEKMKRFGDFLKDIENASFKRIENMGSQLNDFELGESIKNGFDQGVDELFGGLDVTYGNFHKISPGHKISRKNMASINRKLNGLEKTAKGLKVRGAGEERRFAKAVLDDIKAVRASGNNFKQVVESMQSVGRQAFKKGKALEGVAVDKKKLRDIYFTLRDSVLSEVKDFNPQLAEDLISNNEKVTSFFQNNKNLAEALDKVKSAEDAAKVMGKVENIRSLREVLPDQVFKDARASFIGKLAKFDSKTGNFSYQKTLNALDNRKTKMLVDELFIDSPGELQELIELLEVGKRAGDAILNFSGTDRSGVFRDFFKNIINGATNEEALIRLKEAGRKANRVKKLPAATKRNSARPQTVQKPPARNFGNIQKALIGGQSINKAIRKSGNASIAQKEDQETGRRPGGR